MDAVREQDISFSEKKRTEKGTINGVKATGLREGLPPRAPAAAPPHCPRLLAVGGSSVPRLPFASSSRSGSANRTESIRPTQPADDSGCRRGGDVGGVGGASAGSKEVGGTSGRGTREGGAGSVPGPGPRAPPHPRGFQGRAAQHRPLPLQGQPLPPLFCLSA